MVDKLPENELANALRTYQEYYQKHIQQAPNPALQDAMVLIAKARKILKDSGLGNAFAPTLVYAVSNWHAWQKRDDFMNWVGFPASDIAANAERDEEKNTFQNWVSFTYSGTRYGVNIFGDWKSRMKSTAEFKVNDETVLKLLLRDDYATCAWWDVLVYKPGKWMKDLIEIAAHIKKHDSERSTIPRDKDYVKRAKDIIL